ncbi:MAG: hypothetical protein A2X94_15075 [Bdellovibrionales bacterium GWB1_55_8]|nr:MAG: hypothetical protein A2X94_15075 [Bdellovibrionales bacterium GWB1_55_8]
MKPHWINVVRATGLVTFREILRDKLLYNIVLFAILVFGAALLAAQLTHIQPERLLIDLGLSGIAISGGMIAILAGSGLLHREVERRTIHLALSRPVSRPIFLLGKFTGLSGIIALNWLLLSAALLAMTAIFAAASGMNIGTVIFSPTLFLALIFLLMQSLLLGSMTVFFSTFSTPSLSVIFSFGIYLVGVNTAELRFAAEKIGPSLPASLLNGLALVLPSFERFAPGTRVTYDLPFGFQEAAGIFIYGLALISMFLAATGLLIRKREI